MHKPLCIGHRGAKSHIYENTLPSIQKGFQLGANGVEIDVHCCKTGEVIVFHDLDLKRCFKDSRLIENLTYNELRTLRLEGEFIIPTLNEVLEIIPKNAYLNIELKGRNTALPVFELLKTHTALNTNIIISSFHKQELKSYRTLDANAKLGVLTNFNFQEALYFSETINAYSFHPHYSLLNEDSVQLIKQRGLKIFTWTVNTNSLIKTLSHLQVDAIITDDPLLFN
ncbi:glycerophosphodiester phosphodiesterase [Croceibacter atlanticus]|uniref:glycerophosphodiester phosphodiesterase n=1 Tax=Croceibacter atlanticus TaxID=313588 RepID=UPI0030DAFA48|tara:strand:+ start:124963 stop:125640 length:678 start_codon:yes stop_codon:yes gene_type:complete